MAAGSWEIKIDRVLRQFGVTMVPLQDNAAEELESSLQDYHDLAQQYGDLMKKYCYETKPEKRNGIWCCPDCGKRIQYHHSHCHWCGAKLGWG